MYKIEIKNASVKDSGYGLEVNGKPLSEIISTLLGTRVGNKTYYTGDGLEAFNYNSCDITVSIEPHCMTEWLEADGCLFNSIEEMEADRLEQFNEKSKKTDAKE